MRFTSAILAAGLFVQTASSQIPVSGRPVPGMAVFDTIMSDFLTANNITAGVLGISRAGRIEYLRAFGWLHQPGTPLPETAMMRTASVVKPVTAAAVRHFAAAGGFGTAGLGTNAFTGLVIGKSGLLSVTPQPSLGDGRHADITLAHLLLHEGGFDRLTDPPGDVMFKSRTVANALGINSPPSTGATMSYMLGRSLQWTPGTVGLTNAPDGTDPYSNYGYMVLGEVLQQRAPGGYFGYIHTHILSPDLWIPSTEFALARTFPADRHPREPRYIASNSAALNVFDNTPPIENVPMPDGGFAIEQMMAHGGTIASAQAMIRFANAYHLWYADDRVGRRITATDRMRDAAHSGRLDGTNTVLAQRADGIVYYLALNRTDFGDPDLAGRLATLVNTQINNQALVIGGFTWPGTEADGFWVNLGVESTLPAAGGYHSTCQGFQNTLNRVAAGTRLRIKPGSQSWTGTITKRLRLDAPEGEARLGP